jgi:membrane protease YdiL (CAAX protease family)
MVVLDALLDLIGQTLVFAIIAGIVYAVTRLLRLHYRTWTVDNPKVSALWAIGAVVIWVNVLSAFPEVLNAQGYVPAAEREFGVTEVLSRIAVSLIFIAPALLVIWLRKESIASTGLSKHNLGGALIVGSMLSIIVIALGVFGQDRSAGEVIGGLKIRHLWALFYYAFVGFSEEFLFRGYLQSRLIIWLGRWQGWLLASILMALAHIVNLIVYESVLPVDAVARSLALIPISLLMGYVMLRTENIVAPTLAHTFANWITTLG